MLNVLKKAKEKFLYDLNYTNKYAYISLSLFSIGCILRSLCFPVENKWFVILSAIGCSGIVSVIVAALIEKSNNRIQKKFDKKIIEHLLFSYDIHVKAELQRALICCEKNKEIDLEGEYSITEIRELLNQVDHKNVYFKGFPVMLEKCINDLSAISFLELQKDDDGLNLYSLFSTLQSCQNEMNRIVNEEWASESLKILVLTSFGIFEEINETRNKKIKYSISEETAKYLQSFRIAKQEVEEGK